MNDKNISDQNNNDEDLIKTEPVTHVVESSNESIEKLKEVVSPTAKTPSEKDIANNKEIAAASYVWLLSVPIFLFRKDSPFIQKHAMQGLVLFGFSIVSFFIFLLPYIGWIGFIMLILYMIIAVKGFVHAFNGEYYHAPVITDFIENKLKQIQEEQPISAENTEEIKVVVEHKIEEEQKTMEDISSKVHNVLDEEETTKDNSINTNSNSQT